MASSCARRRTATRSRVRCRSSPRSASGSGPTRQFVVLAGNHDHGLAAGWIDARLQTEPAGFLGLEQHFEAHGPLARALAEAARPARLQFAYPGLWLRDDVYAFHGHYADAHATVPTFERILVGAMAKWIAPLPDDARRPTTTRPSSARSTPGCTRSRSARTTRSCPRAAARPRARTGRSRPSAPRARSRSRPATGRRCAASTCARARPAAVEPVTDGAAARLPAAASPK